jgi:GxxExxY protein
VVDAAVSQSELNGISGQIIDAAMAVHSALGPGLLESTYQACLAFELQDRGVAVRSQVPLPLVYQGRKLEIGYRIDLLVCELVIVEIKAVEAIAPVHKAQLLSYLKLSDRRLGLLLNFNVVHMRDGIIRMVNNF